MDLSHPSSGDVPDPDLVIITHVSSPGITGLSVRRRSGAPVLGRAPVQRLASGQLDSITTSRISYDALRVFDPDVYQLLTPLWNVQAFGAQILLQRNSLELLPRNVISGMGRHLNDMYAYGIVRRTREVKAVMKLFTVAKKNGRLRLIQDCRPLNRQCHRPPRMPLDSIHEFIREILSSAFVGTSDGKSFFYQFGLSPEVQKFFGAKVRASRGHHDILCMQSLPMGFSWAPFFAQTFANSLIKGLGKAWVDNFIISASSADEYDARREEFLRRAALLNVALDDYEIAPHRQIELIGLYFDLDCKTYRLADDFVAKTVPKYDAFLGSSSSPGLAALEVIGGAVWFCYVTRTHLCNFPHVMQLLRTIASKGWTETVDVDEPTQSEVRILRALIAENTPRGIPESHSPEITVEGDASDTTAAYLMYNAETVVAALQESTPEQHIFLSELDIAVKGCIAAYEKGVRGVEYRGDNMAALVAIQKRLSSNFAANRMLSRLPTDLTVKTTYVPTAENLADPFTRGVKLPTLPAPIASIRRLHELFQQQRPRVGAQA
jgi:hypothetical protein